MPNTLFPIPKDLFYTLRCTESEADVSQVIVAELPTGRKEHLGTDYLHDNLLIEFKHNVDMRQSEGDRATILAQACYYCYRLRINEDRVPPYIALVDKDEIIVYQRKKLEHIYKNELLFQKGNPSQPDTAVIEPCKSVEPYCYQFINTEKNCQKAIRKLQDICLRQVFSFDDVEEIDKYNVIEAFTAWSNKFDQFMANISTEEERPRVFEIDATGGGKIVTIQGATTDAADDIIAVNFTVELEIFQIENCKRSYYTDFWTKEWKRVNDKSKQKEIFDKIYDLIHLPSRRRKGQFYTITPLAQRGWEYIEKILGKGFYQDGTWRIWDNSAGQGGLVLKVIPDDALQYTYLSTIDNSEVAYLKIHTAARKIFRFDFINGLTSELPPELQRDMKDPNVKWLFFINPPYGEAGSGKATDNAEWHKAGVSQTLIRERMGRYGMLRESKEKYAQFLFRIQDEFKGKFVLGLYSKIKAFVSKEYINLRKSWRTQFKCGFICCAGQWRQSAKNGQFPIAFSVFDSRENGKWEQMNFDILEYKKGVPHGIIRNKKSYTPEDINRSFRNYFFPAERLTNDTQTVVQSNGLSTFDGKSVVNNYRPSQALTSVFFNSAYMLKQTYSWMVSGVSIHHNLFVHRDNYQKFLCGLGLYWSIKHSWINDPDCLLAPTRDLTKREMSDCMLLALLHERNRCTTAKLPDTVIKTKKGKEVNGGLVKAMLNPFDETLFDWKHLSATGSRALEEYCKYCEEVVDWKHYNTADGIGKWGGHFLYERTKDGLDIENKKPGDGYPLPKSFKDAREKLRIEVENTALELCF